MLPTTTAHTSPVQWIAKPEVALEGHWFTIQPDNATLEQLNMLSEFVQAKLSTESITTWKPYPKELIHLSLFLGFNGKTTPSEKQLLVRKVSEKIATFPAYKIEFLFEEAQLRRAGRWVTLQFDSKATEQLNALVKEVLKESVNALEFVPEHLYVRTEAERAQNPLGSLTKPFYSHITLGVLEVEDNPVWAQKHRDIKTLCNGKLSHEMQTLFVQKYGNRMLSFAVNSVQLTGMAQETLKVAEKRNIALAIIKIGQQPNLTRTQARALPSDFYDLGDFCHAPTCTNTENFFKAKYCGSCGQCAHYRGCSLNTFEERNAARNTVDKKEGFCHSCTIRVRGNETPVEKYNRYSDMYGLDLPEDTPVLHP